MSMIAISLLLYMVYILYFYKKINNTRYTFDIQMTYRLNLTDEYITLLFILSMYIICIKIISQLFNVKILWGIVALYVVFCMVIRKIFEFYICISITRELEEDNDTDIDEDSYNTDSYSSDISEDEQDI